MQIEEKYRFDILDLLRKASYDSFNDRRAYEWKLALSIWATLAVVIAGLTQPIKDNAAFPIKGHWVWIVGLIACILLALLHAYWSNGASRANDLDKQISKFYARKMHDDLSLVFPEKINESISKLPATVGWRQWSHVSQVGITALLSLMAVLILYARSK